MKYFCLHELCSAIFIGQKMPVNARAVKIKLDLKIQNNESISPTASSGKTDKQNENMCDPKYPHPNPSRCLRNASTTEKWALAGDEKCRDAEDAQAAQHSPQ